MSNRFALSFPPIQGADVVGRVAAAGDGVPRGTRSETAGVVRTATAALEGIEPTVRAAKILLPLHS